MAKKSVGKPSEQLSKRESREIIQRKRNTAYATLLGKDSIDINDKIKTQESYIKLLEHEKNRLDKETIDNAISNAEIEVEQLRNEKHQAFFKSLEKMGD